MVWDLEPFVIEISKMVWDPQIIYNQELSLIRGLKDLRTPNTAVYFYVYFFGQFCNVAQSGDDPHEDLATFRNKLNSKVEFIKHPRIFLATYLNHV
jgi:hypothetical protein